MAEYPGMVGGVTATRNANHIMTPIHPDEAALLSVLYPVTTIAGGKLPLINTTATVQGRLVDNIKRPIYGQSCLVYSHPPSVGNILTPGVPLVGAMTGFHRFTDSDIVGIMDSATGAPSSGIFVVEGIPLPGFVPPGNSPLVSGLRFDVVWEGIECSGGGYGVPSEWVLEGYLNPPGGNTWPLSSFQTALVCNTNQQIGSLELSAGSVVDLSVVTHNGTIAVDAASRPLVEIVPRTTRPAGTTPVIVQVTTPNQLNTATASLTVNGVPFTNLAAYWQPVIGPPNWQWQIPANVVLPAGPALLRFSVAELQSSLPTGRSAVPAVNVVRY